MPVAGGESAAVIDFDHAAVAAAPACFDDGPGRGCVDRISAIPTEIDPGVHGRAAEEWIAPHAEARRLVELTFHRLANRHHCEGPRQVLDMRTRLTNARDLTLEVGIGWRPHWNKRAAGGV